MTVPAVAAAVALLTAATDQVHDVVVCPGSRSQAFALVAAKLEQLGTIRLHAVSYTHLTLPTTPYV